MSAHNPNNSQCDLSMYGPDPGDNSIHCTCDEDAPVESAVGPPRVPTIRDHRFTVDDPRNERTMFVESAPGTITLTGRAATTHLELRSAGQELRAAQDLYRKAEARWKAALDAHMQELA